MTVRDEGFLAEAMPANTPRVTHAQFHTRPDGRKLAHHGAVQSVLYMLSDRDKPTEVVKLPNGTEIRLAPEQPNLARPDGYLSSHRAYFEVSKGGKTETVQGSEEATNLAIIVDAPKITLNASTLAECHAVRVSEARVDVSSYVRKDGTFVAPYVQIRKLLSGLGDGESIDTPDGLKVTKQKGGKFTVTGGSGKGVTDTTFDDHTLAAQDLLSRSAGEKHPKSLGGESNIRSEVAKVLPSIERQQKYEAQGKGNAPIKVTARQVAAQRSIVSTPVPENGDDAGYVVKYLQTRGGIKDYDPAKDPAEYRGTYNGKEFPLFTGASLAQMRKINAGVLKHQGKEGKPVKAAPPKGSKSDGMPKGAKIVTKDSKGNRSSGTIAGKTADGKVAVKPDKANTDPNKGPVPIIKADPDPGYKIPPEKASAKSVPSGPKSSVKVTQGGGETKDGGLKSLPFEITVNGRKLSPRQARDVASNLRGQHGGGTIPDGAKIDVSLDLPGANAADIAGAIAKYKKPGGKSKPETHPSNLPGYGTGKTTTVEPGKPDPEMFKKSKTELQSLADGGGSRAGKAKAELTRREAKRKAKGGKSSSGGGSAKGEDASTGGTPIDQRYFRMGKTELQNLAGHGDAGAKRELSRRDKKRGGKVDSKSDVGTNGFVPRDDISRGFDADTGQGPKGTRGEVGKIGKVNVGVHQEGDTWHVSRFPGGKSVGTGKSRDEALRNATQALGSNPAAGKSRFDPKTGKSDSGPKQSIHGAAATPKATDTPKIKRMRSEYSRTAQKIKRAENQKRPLTDLQKQNLESDRKNLKSLDGQIKRAEADAGPGAGRDNDGKLRAPKGLDTPSDDLGAPQDGDSAEVKRRRQEYARMAKGIKSREGRLEDLSETQRGKLAADKRQLKVMAANLRILLKR